MKPEHKIEKSGWIRRLITLIILLTGLYAHAQTDVIIGAGSQSISPANNPSGDYGPIYRSSAASAFDYSIHHHLFTAAELSSIPGGTLITKIAWYKNNASATIGNAQKLNIYIKNSSLTTAPTPPQSFSTLTSGATLVYSSSSQAIGSAIGWVEFTLATPIVYTGGGLEVTIDWDISNVAGNPTNLGFVWKSDPVNGRVISYINSIAGANLDNARTSRAQTKFTYTGGSPCSGMPSPGNTIASASNVCAGVNFFLSLQNPISGTGVTYQWYANNSPISGATNSALNTSITGSTDFYCLVTCTASGQSASSTPVTVTTNCYCLPNSSGGASFYGQIQKVTFDSINKTSSYPLSSPYYTNYAPATGTTTSVYKGFSYPITVKVGTSAQAAVWFDWNHNYAFEASEYTLLGSNYTNPSANFTQNINVPANAASGPTLMRVRAKDGLTTNFTSSQACLLSDYGESEDYTITIVAPPACSGTPSPGNTVSSVANPCAGVNFTLSMQNSFFETGLTYQWYNNGGAISGATDKQFMTSISNADNFYCTVTCTNSGMSATSVPIALTMMNFDLCYCTSSTFYGAGGANGLMTKVVFESIYNESIHPPTATPYATVYPVGLGTSTQILKGNSYPLSVSVSQNTKAAVWIDWNQNGNFEPSEFMVLGSNTTNAPTVFTQNIFVPVTASSGITRMRIRSRDGADTSFTGTDVCLTSLHGETEDYYLQVLTPVLCTGTPSPGNTTSNVSNACAGTQFFLGLANPDNGADATYQWYSGAGIIAGATHSFYVATFTATDNFWCEVTCPTSGMSVNSGSVTITSNPPLSCYCVPLTQSGCSGEDVVARFKVNTLDNNTGTSCPTGTTGYSDFTANGSLTTSIQKGIVYTAQAWAGPTWGQGFAVWIDYNDNGIFEHPAERVGYTVGYILGGGTATFPLAASCNASEGIHRLRVRCKYATMGIDITPCDYQFAGETEDYLITLSAPATSCTAPYALAASNILSSSADMFWTAGCSQTLWDINIGLTGSGIPVGPPSHPHVNSPFTITGLQPNTNYDVYVRAVCDSTMGITSAWSSVYTFQTQISPCTGMPAGGTAVSNINMVCPNSNLVNFSLTGASATPGITYQWYNNAGLIAGASNATYNTNVTASDNFYCAVTCSYSGLTANSGNVTITQGSYLNCYCIPTASCTFPDIITNVTFAGINRNSTCDNPGNSGYSVFNAAPNTTTITQGATYPMSVSTGGDLEGAAVWIDYDHSGTFDATELVLHGYAGTNPATYTGGMTVPLNALPGATMMRVRCTYNVDPSVSVGPCTNVQYGETEDYQIQINPVITTNTLSLTSFIQGYMSGNGTMYPVLANQGQAAAANDCDTIDVALHSPTTYAAVAATHTVLHQDGTATCVFNPGVTPGNYFIVVRHRNAVETWSATAIPVATNFTYNFSDAASKAYGANQIQVSSSPAVYAFYSGDVMKDNGEIIDLLDLIQLETEINAFGYGYKNEDLNGDGNVDLLDSPLMEPNINAFIYSNHP